MTTRSYVSRSQVIQSVNVRSVPAPVVFVVTQNPALTEVVRDFIRQTNDNVSVVWLTSVASACRRLEWGGASMVILDNLVEAKTTDEDLTALQSAAPGTRVLVLAEDAVRL